MVGRRRWLAFLAWLLFLLCGCAREAQELPPVSHVRSRQLHDLIREGKAELTLVNVWASWCAPCREEIPALLRIRKEYRERGFELILFSVDDLDEVDSTLRPMLSSLGVDFPTYVSSDSNDDDLIEGLAHEWNGVLPTSLLFNRGDVPVEVMIGKQSYEKFEESIRRHLPPGS